MPDFRGSFRLFRFAGTDVLVHWSWFVVACVLVGSGTSRYSSLTWQAAEYVAGFGLVLAHEFGHVLVCRRVGGAADRVVLWPLGGLAFVAPPPRPGATLWTAAAGPLVNLALEPVLIALAFLTALLSESGPPTNAVRLYFELAWFNAVLVAFNLLPLIPLDGGHILHAVLWRWRGRGKGLAAAAWTGLVSWVGLGLAAMAAEEWWGAALSAILALAAMGAAAHARLLVGATSAPRRSGPACPSCGAAPPVGEFWRCFRCWRRFDLFAPATRCPTGGGHMTDAACLECGRPLVLSNSSSPASTDRGTQDHGDPCGAEGREATACPSGRAGRAHAAFAELVRSFARSCGASTTMSHERKCYRCGKEDGGWSAPHYACQAVHCAAHGRPICANCLTDLDRMRVFKPKNCPACQVGHMKKCVLKCYRCAREGGFALYYACQATVCPVEGHPICDDCIRELDDTWTFRPKKCPACEVGRLKLVG